MAHAACRRMTDRSDFSEQTKRYLALRAGHRCSFTGCRQATSGPSRESPSAVTNIGEASHICAASPGGRRYDPAVTPEERSHIDNGIWLCVTHARLIDRDEVEYPAERLRRMKREHEEACAVSVRGTAAQLPDSGLIAIGPDIVVLGSLQGIDGSEWTLRFGEFVQGDLKALVDFVGGFDKLPAADRYLLVDALGDGRVITAPPSVLTGFPETSVRCRVAAPADRSRAQDLGSQWAVHPETHDLHLKGGNVARVSGLDSLPQVIRQSLSMQRGESPFHPAFGARLGEYFEALRDSPWLGRFVKLEIIRLASIPYVDEIARSGYTPLRCIERVRSVEFLSEPGVERRLPVRLDLDVKGVGRWQCEVAILVAGERFRRHRPASASVTR